MSRAGGSLAQECEYIRAFWAARLANAEMTPGTVARYERVLSSFTRFVQANNHSTFALVSTQTCRTFVHAPRKGGQVPAQSTSRFRLTVVRDAYLALQQAAVLTINPTSSLRVTQTPQSRESIPLTPYEAARLRAAGRISPRDHVRPAVVELALAGGSHTEIAETVVADLDLEASRVRLGTRWA